MAAHVLECYTCYKGQEVFEASLININEVSKHMKSKAQRNIPVCLESLLLRLMRKVPLITWRPAFLMVLWFCSCFATRLIYRYILTKRTQE